MCVIYVDADACPVKNEIYRVAKRHRIQVWLVANAAIRFPAQQGVQLKVVSDRFDAADDWIVEQAAVNDIVITADIRLASRCLKNSARVLSPTGHEFTDAAIGSALAARDLLAELRGMGAVVTGPAPFSQRDRSRFLHALHQWIEAVRRKKSRALR
ncbi:MAG TPA: YaiI/YqxD family protein [bacterium]|nr:YaiI/YqxD family protein [bacterium]